jgi:poly-gamma-glutamate synthesis protein (capsule biosynthesis protein)
MLVAIIVIAMTVEKSPNKPGPSPNPTTTVKIRAVGDIMMGRHVGVLSHQKDDWTWAFKETIPKLPPADFVVGNLEFPIVDKCPYRSDGMVFCAPPESMNGLAFAGLNLVSLANNHSGNYGSAGLETTVDTLNANNISPLSEYQTEIKIINSIPIGFLALHDLYTPINASKTTDIIQDLKSKAAIVIILAHWGNEYETFASVRQKKLAEEIIQAGASIIIGSHPHVVQPIDSTDTTLVAYSLGNFVFDQMWSEETRKGIILDLDLEFTGTSLTHITPTTHPITIHDYGQPRLDKL